MPALRRPIRPFLLTLAALAPIALAGPVVAQAAPPSPAAGPSTEGPPPEPKPLPEGIIKPGTLDDQAGGGAMMPPGGGAAPPPGQAAVEGADTGAPIPDAKSMAEWPCVQGKVENLSIGAIWDGPEPPAAKGWYSDKDVSELIELLKARRVKLETAEAALKAFADKQPADKRDERLALVFSALFETMNSQRRGIISGITKYQHSQKQRSAELENQSQAIISLEEKAKTDQSAQADLDKAQYNYQWATRIFQDRQTSIPLACELPVLLEERLYSLTRTIRGLMSG